MTPTAELLTRVFALLERASKSMGCGCNAEDNPICNDCFQLKYDIDGILDNEP